MIEITVTCLVYKLYSPQIFTPVHNSFAQAFFSSLNVYIKFMITFSLVVCAYDSEYIYDLTQLLNYLAVKLNSST